MKWTAQELEARQSALFDLMLGEPVAPLERVAPSERDQTRISTAAAIDAANRWLARTEKGDK